MAFGIIPCHGPCLCLKIRHSKQTHRIQCILYNIYHQYTPVMLAYNTSTMDPLLTTSPDLDWALKNKNHQKPQCGEIRHRSGWAMLGFIALVFSQSNDVNVKIMFPQYSWNTMKYHEIPWKCHEMPWNAMKYMKYSMILGDFFCGWLKNQQKRSDQKPRFLSSSFLVNLKTPAVSQTEWPLWIQVPYLKGSGFKGYIYY